MKKETKYGIISTVVGTIINLVLGITKAFVGIVTNSVSIFFDGINNFSDVASSAFGAVGIGVSKKKPTENYPNGFGRMEYITTFVISVITLIIGGVFVFYSVERFLYRLPVEFNVIYLVVIAVTMVVKLALGTWYFFLHKKDGSTITKALYIDSFMDAGITACTVVCYGLCFVANTVIDAILGIIIGVFVLVSAVKMVVGAFKNLLGYATDISADEVKELLLENGVCKDIKWLKLSDYGRENREALVKAEINEDKKEILSEIEKENKIKIYFVKE